jgi:hypothetical protein
MTIALDLGTFAMRSLRRRGKELVGRRSRSIAVSIADNPARRNYLKSTKAAFLVADGHLVLTGDAAADAAAFFELVPRDLLPRGEIPTADPVARQVFSAVVDALLPWSENPHEVCCFAQPGFPDTAAGGPEMEYRQEFVTRLIRLRGYQPLALYPATALVLCELGNTGFTGIGLALGSSACEISLVHRGMQIAVRRVARGGAWIDSELARAAKIWRYDSLGEQVLDLDKARQRKEAATLAGSTDSDGRLVADLYRSLLADIMQALADLLDSDARIPLLPRPLPVVCGGGPSQIAGFREVLTSRLREREVPVALSDPQFATDHQYALCRGCLIRAELERTDSPHARQKRSREPVAARLQ